MAAGLTGPTEIADPAVIEEICRFRARVWNATGKVRHDAFGADGWRDPFDFRCQHWVIRASDGRLVAAGRLTIYETLGEVQEAEEYHRYGLDLPGPIATPDRVVVCQSMQGRGLGWQILDAQDEAAARQGAIYAVRQASPTMVRLLRRRGWNILGPATADPRFAGVTFQVAVFEYSQPARDIRAKLHRATNRDHGGGVSQNSVRVVPSG